MESGNGVADVLTGRVAPCGKLTSTIAEKYEDYPSADCFGGRDHNCYKEDVYVGYRYFSTFAPAKALYPFGFGLSYTTFKTEIRSFERTESGVALTVSVKNTGNVGGKEIVEIYMDPPCGILGRPKTELKRFAKTPLLAPGGSCDISFDFSDYDMAAFDDSGVTGYKNSYVLEGGKYVVRAAHSVDDTADSREFSVNKTICICTLTEICAVKAPFERIVAEYKDGKYVATYSPVPQKEKDLKQVILNNLPEDLPFTGDKGIKLSDVADGKADMRSFMAQLTNDELERLTRGAGGIGNPLGPDGNGGVFGGTTQSLRDKGIPVLVTTDGPSGVRLSRHAALLPCGTLLACTWNVELVQKLCEKLGYESNSFGSDVLLGPGMNIHRNPLCGRNFEYFSEDPVVSGFIAAAFVKGVQKFGNSACIKHFACNNQEVRRHKNDSRVSQRALREIYLKGFEIAVHNSDPHSLMTSYNLVNGVWSHYNYDLVQTVLREEWGFDKLVMTDWWLRPSYSPEFPNLRDQGYRIRARVNLMMPGNLKNPLWSKLSENPKA